MACGRDPAAGALHPLQVAGRCLDADAVGRQAERAPRSRSAISSSRAASRGRAPTIVRSIEVDRQATGRAPGATTSASSRSLAIPRGVRASAGKRRPRSPIRRRPGARRRPRGVPTSPSEWPCRRGAPSKARPPRRSGSPGPKRCPSCPNPIRGEVVPVSIASAAAEVGGHRHLEVAGVAGDGMNGDGTGLEQRGLIGERRPRHRRGSARRRVGAGSPRTPCGVCAAASVSPVDRRR